jgi:hypothetical protein
MHPRIRAYGLIHETASARNGSNSNWQVGMPVSTLMASPGFMVCCNSDCLHPCAAQVLVELEPAPHQATELSGDAGAVGRIIADAEAGGAGCV